MSERSQEELLAYINKQDMIIKQLEAEINRLRSQFEAFDDLEQFMFPDECSMTDMMSGTLGACS